MGGAQSLGFGRDGAKRKVFDPILASFAIQYHLRSVLLEEGGQQRLLERGHLEHDGFVTVGVGRDVIETEEDAVHKRLQNSRKGVNLPCEKSRKGV